MNFKVYVPGWAEMEVEMLVPPDEKKQHFWRKCYQKIRSLFVKNHVKHNQMKGHPPIVMVRFDIHNVNAFLNATDYDHRRCKDYTL